MVKPTLALATLLLVALPALPSRADDVHLTNGESFEGVVAEMAGDQVRILMAGGEMRLPRSLVLRIEEAEVPYRRYLEREAELAASPESTGHDWLELADWALRHGLRASAREAARTAAELDPELPALPRLMHRLGYLREKETGLWLPRDEARARAPREAGTQAEGGELRRQITSEIHRAAEEARRREQELAAVRREAVEEVRRVMEEARPPESSGSSGWPAFQPGLYVTAPVAYAVPGAVVVIRGGIFSPGPSALPPAAATPASQPPLLDLFERQPGSLLPGNLDLRP